MRTRPHRHPLLRALCATAIAVAALAAPLPSGSLHAATRPSVEYQVKASFLFNFFRFVEWPEHAALPNDRLLLGVVGPDRLGSALDEIDGKSIGGRRIEVRRFAAADDVEPCHIVFVTIADDASERAVLDRLRDAPVLTVGESSEFIERGGVIRFYVTNSRVRFEIDPLTANRGGMRIGASLLQIGRR